MYSFNKWWNEEGSGIRPKDNEEVYEFAKRICSIAWLNGCYVGHREAIAIAEDEAWA